MSASNSPLRSPIGHPFHDEDFQVAFEVALAGVSRGMGDLVEVLAVGGRVVDGDPDSWVQEWTAVAGAAWSEARVAVGDGRRVSARASYLRAAGAYAAALRLVARSSEPERYLPLWRRQRECWEGAADLFPAPVERLAIAYGTRSMPGYFFSAPDAAEGEPRPLVIVNNDDVSVTSQTWITGGAAASERGYHWMTFDGPGQQALRFKHGLSFRADWEAVLTPVVDTMLARRDVDGSRIAVIGAGVAGYLVPRALAFEHRLVAAVVDPGVVDVSVPWLAAMPEQTRQLWARGALGDLEHEIRLIELFSPVQAQRLHSEGAPYGFAGNTSDADIGAYRLGAEVGRITTPLLITTTAGEKRWPGQSRALFEGLTGPKCLVDLTPAADRCDDRGPGSWARRERRIFDWLDGYLA